MLLTYQWSIMVDHIHSYYMTGNHGFFKVTISDFLLVVSRTEVYDYIGMLRFMIVRWSLEALSRWHLKVLMVGPSWCARRWFFGLVLLDWSIHDEFSSCGSDLFQHHHQASWFIIFEHWNSIKPFSTIFWIHQQNRYWEVTVLWYFNHWWI